MFIDWADVVTTALEDLGRGFIVFLPKLIGALIIFLVGWVVAVAVGKVVAEILRKLRFNKIFEKGAWRTALERAEFKVDASGFIGAIFKWVLVIVFLSAAVEILGMAQFAAFLNEILAYLPRVVMAALIFVVTVIIADIVEKVVRAAVEGTRVGYGAAVSAVVKWSIWIFAVFVILDQLLDQKAIILTLMQGIIGLIVLAGGIAFGLGGKEVAAEMWQDLKRKIKE